MKMIDLKEYLKNLRKEKYRAVIIHHKDTGDLSDFAKRAAGECEGYYFDILKYFEEDEDVAKRIDSFDLTKLSELLKEKSDGEDILIVDNIGVLLATWQKYKMEEFFSFIKRGWNSFYSSMNSTIVFCLYGFDGIDELKIETPSGKSRVLELTQLRKTNSSETQ